MLEEENKETPERIRLKSQQENNHDKQRNETNETYELQTCNKETTKGISSTTNEEEIMMRTGRTSEGEATKEIGVTKTAVNGQSESHQIEICNGTNNSNNKNSQNTEHNRDNNKTNMENNNSNCSKKNNNGGNNNKSRVNIMEPGDMATYTFTISWRPD
jgi:hypothetical protein